MKILLVLMLTLSTAISISGQNLENIGGSPFQVSGNISVGSSFYKAIDRDNRRSPFAYFISANPTFSIYGLDIPVSFVYRDQQGSISNPFNRFSINPTYKWVSLHIGNVGLNMNPYTLSGQLIKGGGVELTPGHFRFAIVAGKLENPLAQLDTIVEGAQILTTYDRNAVAAKLGYGSQSNFIEFSALKAKDDINSVDRAIINPRLVKPEENVVIGTSFGISPVKWISLRANIAASAHTANQETIDLFETEELTNLKEDFGDVVTLNFSSKLQFAGDVGLDFKFKNFGFGGEYKRVDPLYKSLGTFYFQEDYENFLAKINFTLGRGKLRVTGRGGIQRNNLNNLRSVTSTRQIYNGSITYSPSRAFAATARYSNFQTERSPGLVAVNDTLRYARTTAVYGFSPRFTFGSRERSSSITLSVNYQNLDDVLADEATDNNIDNYNATLSYGINLRPSATRISLSLIGNQNSVQDRETRRLGGNIRWSKKLLGKKLTLSTSAGYLQNYINAVADGSSITGRVGIRYRLKRQFSSALNINYLQRGGSNAYQEIRGTVKFTYLLPTKKSKQ